MAISFRRRPVGIFFPIKRSIPWADNLCSIRKGFLLWNLGLLIVFFWKKPIYLLWKDLLRFYATKSHFDLIFNALVFLWNIHLTCLRSVHILLWEVILPSLSRSTGLLILDFLTFNQNTFWSWLPWRTYWPFMRIDTGLLAEDPLGFCEANRKWLIHFKWEDILLFLKKSFFYE